MSAYDRDQQDGFRDTNDQDYLQNRGEDYGDNDFRSPKEPTFPIPYGRREHNPQRPTFPIPYGNQRRESRRSGFHYPNQQHDEDLYYGNVNDGNRYNDLSRRGVDTGDRPVWERDRSLRAGFRFGTGEDQAESHRGKGPKNYQRADNRIMDDVNDRLADDPYLDASDIEVSVVNCEVTLKGTVDSRGAKRRAEDLAESVSGVKNVENLLRASRNTEWRNRDGNREDRTVGTTRSNFNEQGK